LQKDRKILLGIKHIRFKKKEKTNNVTERIREKMLGVLIVDLVLRR